MNSLIVSCYNGAAFVERCLNCILTQTNKDIEFIFVNDGSTDKTDEIIRRRRDELEEKLARFVYIYQENQGVGAAYNNAFKKVTGKYMSILDVDDLLLPESIEERVSWLDNNENYVAVRTNGYYVSDDDIDDNSLLFETNEKQKRKEEIFEDIVLDKTYTWAGSWMIRVDLLDSIYPDREIYPSRSGQNLQFLMVASYFGKVGFIDKPLMKYIARKESLSHFKNGDVLQRKVDAIYGYKDIRTALIEKFITDETEKKVWSNRLEVLYDIILMKCAGDFKNKPLMKENYQKLKRLNVDINLDTKILYYQLINPFIYYILRVVRKIKNKRLK